MDDVLRIKATIEKGSDNRMRLVASTEAMDRDGEIIKLDGWDLKNFKANPVFLWAHDHRSLPLGHFVNIRKNSVNGRLEGEIEWASFDANPFAQFVRAQFEEGIMKMFSVGFIPRERDPQNPFVITKAELLEVSAVPVPSNPQAMVLSVKGFAEDKAKSLADVLVFDENHLKAVTGKSASDLDANQLAQYLTDYWRVGKDVVPYKKHPNQSKETGFDEKDIVERLKVWATNEEGELDKEKMGGAFGWVKDGEGAFLHHDVIEEKLVTNWRGLVRSMADLLSGSVQIPSDDIKGVYNHLAKHYKDFGEEAPELRSYTGVELKEIFGDDVSIKDEELNQDIENDNSEGQPKTEDLGEGEEGDEKNVQIITLKADFRQKISDVITALQAFLDGSEDVFENGKSIGDLSGDESEDIKTYLKAGKLLSENIMRKLNQRQG